MSDFQYNAIEGELDLIGCGDDAVERFFVNVTYSEGSYSADKTYAEITSAITAGNIITLRYLSLEYVYSHTVESDDEAVSKHCFYESSDDNLNYVNILSDESVEILSFSPAAQTPKVTTVPSDGAFDPDKLYVLDLSSTASLTMTLNAAASGVAAEYHIIMTTGNTAPTITWPSGLTWDGGNAPTIAASHKYEIDIIESLAICKDWGSMA